MKKLTILALAAMFAVGASAQDVFKQVKKMKSTEEVEQAIKANVASMPDQEKAECYNHLARLYNKVVNDHVTKNQENAIMQKPQIPEDENFYNAAYNALMAGELAYKYDQLPNIKGKIAPKFKDLGVDLYQNTANVLNGGIFFNDKDDRATALKFFQGFVDTHDSPMFSAIPAEKKAQIEQNVSQIAYYTALYGMQLDRGMDFVNKYADIAAQDPKYKNEAETIKNTYAAKGLQTREDSIKFANETEARFNADPTNVQSLGVLSNILLGLGENDRFFAACQKYIDAKPEDHIGYLFRGQISLRYCKTRQQYQEVIADLEKADNIKPDDPSIKSFLGLAHAGIAEVAEESAGGKSGIIPRAAKTQIKPVWNKALEYLNKAKELDKDGANERYYKSTIDRINYTLENYYKGIE